MREILFRGKTILDNEWVIGAGVYKSEGNTWIITDDATKTENMGTGSNAINPETVGQYTGLTDKNSKKIFEGDILAFSDRLVYVHWHDYCGCWDCSYLKAVNGKATLHEDRSPNKWRYNAEVIGNIHDNPELLEG